ncbi:MAG TPA: hypothetical protein VFV67_11425 [Actinophytocola sp.]|uniref:hypothetical protein n=1 Tax=Actinophytocola sp. TaxID=1872138 RepID=UPI002DB648B3|nr:hypothetical protein [Actinophytocola sp.]HEU5471255.1 hypothetical protein [Actinophytocola sp.]
MIRAGAISTGRRTVHWTYLPCPTEPFWSDVSPTQGVGPLTAALSIADIPGTVTVHAVEPYADPPGEPAPAPDRPWACYSEAGSTRRIWWPARVASGTAGLLEVAGDRVVRASANNEPFRRKLFRTALLSPLLLAGGVALVHAMAVTRDRTTVLLVGESGSGKSTLGLAAVAAGWRVLAEDTVFVATAGIAVVPLFLSGAWESRVLPHDRAIIAEITGSRLEAHDPGLPHDHRGRDYRYTNPGPDPDRPVPVDLVVFVSADGTAGTHPKRFGEALRSGPDSTLGAMARLLHLDFAPVMAETATAVTALGDLPSRIFRASGDLAADVRDFLRLLDT